MHRDFNIKKLFRIAVFTSTGIGIIFLGPAFVIGIIFGNINTSINILLLLLTSLVIGVSLFVFLFWSINIGLLVTEQRLKWFHTRPKARYITSYVTVIGLLFFIRLCASPLFASSQQMSEILMWKIKTFGLNPSNIDYMQFSKLFVQLLIIVFVALSVNTMILILLDLILVNEKKVRAEAENNRLKLMNIEAANQKLKQQLQPHFLFNSLNVLKTLIRKQPDNAEAYLKRLSDFLRASVTYDHLNTVTLAEELKLSIDYIEMQKIRFEDALQFENCIPPDVNQGILPLFAIQLLLENAIKHNAFTIENPLHIKLTATDGWITVTNNLQPRKISDQSTGMGLANLTERYRILSGHEVAIRSNGTSFSVSIKIVSHEDCYR